MQPVAGFRWSAGASARPATNQSREQGGAGAAERKGERPDLHAEQSGQQTCRNSRREEGNVGAVAIAQDLPDLHGRPLDVAGDADKRHDVADIDPGVRGDRDFLSPARQIPKEYAARGILDYFAQCPAVQLVVADEDAKGVARNLAQHIRPFDFGADRGARPDEGRARSGEDNFIVLLENIMPGRLDIASLADDAFNGDALADAIFDSAYRLAGGRHHAVGPRLEFSKGEVSGVGLPAAGQRGFQRGERSACISPAASRWASSCQRL